MAENFGWAYISGSSVTGPNNSVVFKKTGVELSGSSKFTYTAASRTINLEGTVSLTAATAGDLGITAPEGVRVSGLMGINGGNRRLIDYAELVPNNSVTEVFGPITINASGSITVGTNSHIAIKPWPY